MFVLIVLISVCLSLVMSVCLCLCQYMWRYYACLYMCWYTLCISTQFPEMIHSKEKGWRRVVMFVMINIGFAISFMALLLLAIYEEDLNTLVTV